MYNVWIATDWHLWNKTNNAQHPFKSVSFIGKLADHYTKDIDESDVFIHLGDICDPGITDTAKLTGIISAIPGYKILCKGNHDQQDDSFYKEIGFDEVCDICVIHSVVFSHKPLNIPKDMINVHGHLHSMKIATLGYQHVNAYVTNQLDRPILLEELLDKGIAQKPVDYDGTNLKHVVDKFDQYTSIDNDQYSNVIDKSDLIQLTPIDESILNEFLFPDVASTEYWENDDNYDPHLKKKEPMADGEGTLDEAFGLFKKKPMPEPNFVKMNFQTAYKEWMLTSIFEGKDIDEVKSNMQNTFQKMWKQFGMLPSKFMYANFSDIKREYDLKSDTNQYEKTDWFISYSWKELPISADTVQYVKQSYRCRYFNDVVDNMIRREMDERKNYKPKSYIDLDAIEASRKYLQAQAQNESAVEWTDWTGDRIMLATYEEVQEIMDRLPKKERRYAYTKNFRKHDEKITAYLDAEYLDIEGEKRGAWLHVFAFDNDPEYGVVDIGADVEVRGKGLTDILITRAIAECPKIGINHLIWKCDKANIPSQKLAKRNGFKPYKIKEEKGQYVYVYDMVATNESTGQNDYWYHLVPKGADVSEGILSPAYMMAHKMDVSEALDKYRDRLVGGWNIYPGRDPDSLTDQEIHDGLIKFRGQMGAKQIYLFKYPPTADLGKNMKKTLAGKDLYRVDLSKVKDIVDIDYGYEGSHTDNRKLSPEDYQINPDTYFSQYDDKNPMLFSTINHISIATRSGRIHPSAITKVTGRMSLKEDAEELPVYDAFVISDRNRDGELLDPGELLYPKLHELIEKSYASGMIGNYFIHTQVENDTVLKLSDDQSALWSMDEIKLRCIGRIHISGNGTYVWITEAPALSEAAAPLHTMTPEEKKAIADKYGLRSVGDYRSDLDEKKPEKEQKKPESKKDDDEEKMDEAAIGQAVRKNMQAAYRHNVKATTSKPSWISKEDIEKAQTAAERVVADYDKTKSRVPVPKQLFKTNTDRSRAALVANALSFMIAEPNHVNSLQINGRAPDHIYVVPEDRYTVVFLSYRAEGIVNYYIMNGYVNDYLKKLGSFEASIKMTDMLKQALREEVEIEDDAAHYDDPEVEHSELHGDQYRFFEPADRYKDAMNEAHSKTEEYTEFNLDSWKPNTVHNVLFVTGLSGSGKSTTGRALAKSKKAQYISLDHYTSISRKGPDRLKAAIKENRMEDIDILRKYFENSPETYIPNGPKYKGMADIPYDIRRTYYLKFYNWLMAYCHTHKNQLFVIEGVQLYLYHEAVEFVNEPFICMNADETVALARRIKRSYLKAEPEDGKLKALAHAFENLNMIPTYAREGAMVRKFKKRAMKLDSYLEESYKFELEDKVFFMDRMNEAVVDDGKLYPVYVLLMHSGTALATAIKTVTQSNFSHSSISFDATMHSMYSFGRKADINPLVGGFKKEDIRDEFFQNRDIPFALYVVPASKSEIAMMKKRLDYFIKNSSRFKYDFTGLFKNYFGIADNPEYKWFCSRFVADILNAGRPSEHPYIMEPSLMKPEDFTQTNFALYVTGGNLASYDSSFVERVTNRILRKETERRRQERALQKRLAETVSVKGIDPFDPFAESVLNYQLSMMDENVVDDFFTYLKSFKIKFDKEGNVIISRREYDQLEQHFKHSLKLMKAYESAGNVESVKTELCKINYMIQLINTHYLNPTVKQNNRVKADLKKDMVDLRSVMLNAFKQHLKWVTDREPRFNFQSYYNQSDYGKDTKIPKTVLSMIGKSIITSLR